MTWVAACGPLLGPSGEGAGETSDPEVETENPTTPGTTIAPPDDTGNADAGDTEGVVACEAGPFAGEIGCHPGGTAHASFEIVGFPDDGTFEGECEVVASTHDGNDSFDIVLDCGGEFPDLVTVLLHSTGASDRGVDIGQPVSVLYQSSWFGEDEPDRYLRIRDQAGDLVLLAIDGEGLPSFDTDPLELRIPSSECEAARTDCVYVQRSALEISLGDVVQGVPYYSGSAAALGPFGEYFVVVDHVSRVACWPEDCGVNYATWGVRAIIYR